MTPPPPHSLHSLPPGPGESEHGDSPARVDAVWFPAQPAQPACPSRAWSHPATPDEPRQPGAGRGERGDQQSTPVIARQPGPAQQQPGQLSQPIRY